MLRERDRDRERERKAQRPNIRMIWIRTRTQTWTRIRESDKSHLESHLIQATPNTNLLKKRNLIHTLQNSIQKVVSIEEQYKSGNYGN